MTDKAWFPRLFLTPDNTLLPAYTNTAIGFLHKCTFKWARKISNDSKSRWINYVRSLHGLSYIQYIAYNNDEGLRPFKALPCCKSRRAQNFPGTLVSMYLSCAVCMDGSYDSTRNIVERMQITDSHVLFTWMLFRGKYFSSDHKAEVHEKSRMSFCVGFHACGKL